MPEYRRAYVPGGTYFLTLVTFQRWALFGDVGNISRLREALATVRAEMPFDVVGAVVLPEHCHFMWTLPENDEDFSKRVGRLKVLFTKDLPAGLRGGQALSPSRLSKRESGVWQRRFWEHLIRDERDFRRHMDYVHYNPVKHELVSCPHIWSHSSFARWVQEGEYPADWGCVCNGRQRPPFDFSDIKGTTGEE
jgi:putative transposase